MSNVFKVGSRWDTNGNPARKIFDVFKNINIVFIGENQDGSTHYIDMYKTLVQKDHWFAIAYGLTIVAVAKVVSTGDYIQNYQNIDEDDFPPPSVFDFPYETSRKNAFGWKVEIRYPNDSIIKQKGINVRQERIYRMNKYAKDIIDIFNNHSHE